MNIGCYRNLQFAPDFRKNLATFAHADAAKRADRSSVRFVVRGFENKINIFRSARFSNLLRHSPGKCLRLNNARAKNECGAFTANRHSPNTQWFWLGHEFLRKAGTQQFQSVASCFPDFPINPLFAASKTAKGA